MDSSNAPSFSSVKKTVGFRFYSIQACSHQNLASLMASRNRPLSVRRTSSGYFYGLKRICRCLLPSAARSVLPSSSLHVDFKSSLPNPSCPSNASKTFAVSHNEATNHPSLQVHFKCSHLSFVEVMKSSRFPRNIYDRAP